MIDCPNGEFRDLLPDLLHGRLGVAERAEVEAHLRDCELCRQELELLRDMRTALRGAAAVDVDAIVASLPRYRAPVRHMPARSWGGWRIAAAVTLLAAGSTSVVVARHDSGSQADSVRIAAMRTGESTPLPGTPSVSSALTSGAGSPTATEAAPRELALAGSTIGDLDDSELSALLDDIGSLNAVTPADVDNAAAVGPIAPNSPSGMND